MRQKLDRLWRTAGARARESFALRASAVAIVVFALRFFWALVLGRVPGTSAWLLSILCVMLTLGLASMANGLAGRLRQCLAVLLLAAEAVFVPEAMLRRPYYFPFTCWAWSYLVGFDMLILVGLLLATVVGYAAGRAVRRSMALRIHEDRCAGCGYLLVGNQSGVCPECGLLLEE